MVKSVDQNVDVLTAETKNYSREMFQWRKSDRRAVTAKRVNVQKNTVNVTLMGSSVTKHATVMTVKTVDVAKGYFFNWNKNEKTERKIHIKSILF